MLKICGIKDMISRIIPTDSITDISSELLQPNGKLKLLESDIYKKYRWDDFRAFCHTHARYGIHTMEQQLFLHYIIKGREAIEIGAGAGDLGYHMRILMTDSKQQDNPQIKAAYAAMRQPTIKYPEDVKKRDALDAVKWYKPQVVIGSWITTYAPHEMPYGSNPFGIKENEIIDLVETFILIGNIDTHGDKPIMKIPHEEIYEPWMTSRGKNQENNRIWIWNRKS
jgi:hypothetical protein